MLSFFFNHIKQSETQPTKMYSDSQSFGRSRNLSIKTQPTLTRHKTIKELQTLGSIKSNTQEIIIVKFWNQFW